jgi:hypothetical protein
LAETTRCWGPSAVNLERLSSCPTCVAFFTCGSQTKAAHHSRKTHVCRQSDHRNHNGVQTSSPIALRQLSESNLAQYDLKFNANDLAFDADATVYAVQEAGKKMSFDFKFDCFEGVKQDLEGWIQSQNFIFRERHIFKNV